MKFSTPQGRGSFPLRAVVVCRVYSGPVNQGDTVLLNLYFSSGQVIMYSKDWNTGATSFQSFSAESATTFKGITGQSSDSNGFFTGLMTEEYHVSAYYGSETQVTYSDPYYAISSALMWADEYNSNTTISIFGHASYQLSYSGNPNQFQYFSTNGASMSSNAYEFISGSSTEVGTTMSYNVLDGGYSYSAPTLSYVSNGVRNQRRSATNPTFTTWTAGRHGR